MKAFLAQGLRKFYGEQCRTVTRGFGEVMNDRYSPDWADVATTKKQSVNWVCERCGVQCLRPGEGKGLSRGERYRLRMAVHHCDYDPGNNAPENLRALCSTCHLHYHRRQQGNVTPGQLSLEFCVN